jgi:hypothetical protein
MTKILAVAALVLLAACSDAPTTPQEQPTCPDSVRFRQPDPCKDPSLKRRYLCCGGR